MAENKIKVSGTGVPGLDEVIDGLRIGDNVVWQIDDIEDYAYLVRSFVSEALKNKKKIVYFRFASHSALLENLKGVETFTFDPAEGFESFTLMVSAVIERLGRGVYYVFDSLSELLTAWATDLMISNFFMVTCPRLFELDTIAYFSIMRTSHSHKAVARIRKTTQVLADIYRVDGSVYVHPLKAENRYSHTMFLPHLRIDKVFEPVTDSIKTVEIFSRVRSRESAPVKRNLDYWDRLFMQAQELSGSKGNEKETRNMTDRLCRIMITENPRMLKLAKKYFSLKDLLEIKYRLTGTGLIGGKAAGMLLARKILSSDGELDWESLNEPHDSFFIGSDIFNSYTVENGLWKLYLKQKDPSSYFSAAEELKKNYKKGRFPEEVREQFQQIVEYFGASPVIIRSSSLLEDAFGNAFAGKYESVFCASRGTPSQRYEAFENAVRKVYASTMSRDALTYRKMKNLHNSREQMALLVQRVSGSHHRKYFFPVAGGVGFSHNSYVWNKKLSPEAGMLRIVFGLGTRAVNRVEGDYPRMAALDDPRIRPYAQDDIPRYSQRSVDVISTQENALSTVPFMDLIEQAGGIALNLVASTSYGSSGDDYRVPTLDGIIEDKKIISDFRKILKTLQKAYSYPVEIEFTVNFCGKGEAKINLLQCRPLQTKRAGKRISIESASENMNVFFKSSGNFIGGNVCLPVKKIVHINAQEYIPLSRRDKHETARITGKINRLIDKKNTPSMLIGPGRWGTTTPSLGICVNFYEINNFSFLVETSLPEKGFMPEFSFGTHFFQDIVETDIFYTGLSEGSGEGGPDTELLDSLKNRLTEMLSGYENFKNVVGVYDVSGLEMKVVSDIVSRRIACVYKKTT